MFHVLSEKGRGEVIKAFRRSGHAQLTVPDKMDIQVTRQKNFTIVALKDATETITFSSDSVAVGATKRLPGDKDNPNRASGIALYRAAENLAEIIERKEGVTYERIDQSKQATVLSSR